MSDDAANQQTAPAPEPQPAPAPAPTARSGNGSGKAFVGGLVIGVIVGAFAGVLLPEINRMGNPDPVDPAATQQARSEAGLEDAERDPQPGDTIEDAAGDAADAIEDAADDAADAVEDALNNDP